MSAKLAYGLQLARGLVSPHWPMGLREAGYRIAEIGRGARGKVKFKGVSAALESKGIRLGTMWGPLIINWFINPITYSSKYHKYQRYPKP